MKKAFWNYVNSIISYDHDHSLSERRSVNKKFWSFISSRKKDNITISPLKSFGNTFPDPLDKANILNSQFQSAFSSSCPLSLKHLCSAALSKIIPTENDIVDEDSNVCHRSKPRYPYPMTDIVIIVSGIDKLLKDINPYKACGPDQIQPRVLKELHLQIAPILQIIR